MDSKQSNQKQTAVVEEIYQKEKPSTSNNNHKSSILATRNNISPVIKSKMIKKILASKRWISIKRQSVRPRFRNVLQNYNHAIQGWSDYREQGPYPTPDTSFSSYESDLPGDQTKLMGTTLLYTTYNGPEAAPLSPDYPIFSDPFYGFTYPVPAPIYVPPPIWAPIPPLSIPVPAFPVVASPVLPMLPTFTAPVLPPVIISYGYSCYDMDLAYTDNSYVHSSFDADQSLDHITPADSIEVNQTPNTCFDANEDNSHKENFVRDIIYDPILVVDAFCTINLDATDLLWILDLEFGYNPKFKRPVPVYDVQSRVITTISGVPHPGFDKCDEQFKQILMFHYDGAVSSWYLGYMAYYGDKSVLRFQSWLDEILRRDGMNWMSKYGKHCQFL